MTPPGRWPRKPVPRRPSRALSATASLVLATGDLTRPTLCRQSRPRANSSSGHIPLGPPTWDELTRFALDEPIEGERASEVVATPLIVDWRRLNLTCQQLPQ